LAVVDSGQAGATGDDHKAVTISLDHTVRVRFAPSPTGTLHIGSARTALYNFLFARHAGGSFVVRIEDTDAARSEQRFEQAILDDLAWLGLAWDEGPDRGGPFGPYRQAERAARYRAAADALAAAGLAYPCFCSQQRLDDLRSAALAAGEPPRYDGRCRRLDAAEVERRLAAGEPAALRFAVPPGDVGFDDAIRGPIVIGSEAIGDFIILRSDRTPSYNFAAVVDDAAMAITHVIRGDDHLTNTARQELLRRALYRDAPAPVYAHHAMILAPGGGKLSKRHGATSVGDYRALGYLPQAIVNYLALLSWSHGDDEVLGVERLIASFELQALSASPAIFDVGKLDWLNHQWIMASSDAEHERLVGERLAAGTPAPAVRALAAALKPSLERYAEVPQLVAPVLDRPALGGELRGALAAAGERLELFCGLRRAAPRPYLTPDQARELLAEYRRLGKERLACGPRELLMPLRQALTGRDHGPELHYVLAALDADETLERLAAVAGAPSAGPAPASSTGPARAAPAATPPPATNEGDRR
jgi:nondiscriminating glutamyl-tRNA synthetase